VAPPTDSLPVVSAHRGAILHFLSDPGETGAPGSYEFFEDGLLIVEGGRVTALGPAKSLLPGLAETVPVTRHANSLLMPGFIDTHIHYAQTDVIASGGQQLLDWLRDYTFPAEARFADGAVAAEVADFFLDQLIRNGTTTAMVFCTVHEASVTSFFEVAERRGLRMIAGKVLMDRNCPPELRDSVVEGEQASRRLIERWHGQARLHYAITPRFAPTSSEAQLESAGRLAREFPDVFIQSHLAENLEEIAWVKELFPTARSYLDVYDRVGLVRDRAIYAHCIHLDGTDRTRMAHAHAAASFCPTSNLYLGSGLFDIRATDAAGLRFALGTDVGGGTSFSLLRTLGEAYKVAQMTGQRLSPLRAFYLATLGGARALRLEDRIGHFTSGTEADFVVLDLRATDLIARRMAQARTLEEKLLVLMTLGDERAIAHTYVMGRELRGGLPANRAQSLHRSHAVSAAQDSRQDP
jgi:guanine deaminase